MNDRSPWLVALGTANLLFLVAAAFLVRGRLERIESRIDGVEAKKEPRRDAPPRSATGPTRGGAVEGSATDGDAAAPPAAGGATDAEVLKRLAKLSDDAYDYYDRLAADVHEIKRTGKQVDANVRRMKSFLTAPGQPAGEWALFPADKPLTPEATEIYRRDAAGWGVKVEEGRVEVRGFLNMSPWTTMPIEYFVTRWPEAGHETLLHVLGPAPVDDALTPDRLKGLVTSIYKGLVLAGFKQGAHSRLDPPAPGEPDRPRWVAPTGDVVYVGVRYQLRGEVHVARATDWVIDPSTRAVLPEDAFRFTGSLRQDDHDSGDEQLTAEAGGIVVSVYNDPNAVLEIALASNLDNRYQYHHARIPKPALLRMKDGALLDCVRDRAANALTVTAREHDGKRTPLETAPVLVTRKAEGGEPEEVPFQKTADGWRVVHPSMAKGDWRVRLGRGEAAVESTGYEPLYVDLILSKTPIVPQGDGAKDVPVDLPADLPSGTGKPPK